MKPEDVTYAFAGSFVDELRRAGVQDVCICPGSRSTPLAMLFDADPDMRVWMHLDERSAAFFALGMAKLCRRPVAVLSTSGTAAANFLPAVVEARYARVPLLVLTADRPPELREVGANQTIDQIRLYGSHVKWFVDVSLPEATDTGLRYVRSLACRAGATALDEPPGPVHLNFPFREPLTPQPPLPPSRRGGVMGDGSLIDEPSPLSHTVGEELGVRGPRPHTRVTLCPRVPDPSLAEELAADLSGTERGLIICGPQDDLGLPEAAAGLAGSLGYPILADPLSGLRCGRHDRSLVLDAYDAFLRDERHVEALKPEVVIRFGAMPTSKPVQLYLGRFARARQIIVDGGGGWRDPTLQADDFIYAEPRRFCLLLADALGREPKDGGAWPSAWLSADRATRRVLAERLSEIDEPFEGKAFAELSQLLPDGSLLFAGNSMPVRDLDTFFAGSERTIRFLANRGASGIDGVVSSALGAAAAGFGPLVLVIGDLSFYHDLNGLLAAKLHDLSATIVLLNNDGGGIFSFLPQAAHPQHFEKLFGTPHGLDFSSAVHMYGGSFERVTTWDGFQRALRASIGECGLRVVEVPTERARNVELHRRMWTAVSSALSPQGAR